MYGTRNFIESPDGGISGAWQPRIISPSRDAPRHECVACPDRNQFRSRLRRWWRSFRRRLVSLARKNPRRRIFHVARYWLPICSYELHLKRVKFPVVLRRNPNHILVPQRRRNLLVCRYKIVLALREKCAAARNRRERLQIRRRLREAQRIARLARIRLLFLVGFGRA